MSNYCFPKRSFTFACQICNRDGKLRIGVTIKAHIVLFIFRFWDISSENCIIHQTDPNEIIKYLIKILDVNLKRLSRNKKAAWCNRKSCVSTTLKMSLHANATIIQFTIMIVKVKHFWKLWTLLKPSLNQNGCGKQHIFWLFHSTESHWFSIDSRYGHKLVLCSSHLSLLWLCDHFYLYLMPYYYEPKLNLV